MNLMTKILVSPTAAMKNVGQCIPTNILWPKYKQKAGYSGFLENTPACLINTNTVSMANQIM